MLTLLNFSSLMTYLLNCSFMNIYEFSCDVHYSTLLIQLLAETFYTNSIRFCDWGVGDNQIFISEYEEKEFVPNKLEHTFAELPLRQGKHLEGKPGTGEETVILVLPTTFKVSRNYTKLTMLAFL